MPEPELLITGLAVLLSAAYLVFPLLKASGLDDREPESEENYLIKLRERLESVYQGLEDLKTERDLGNINEEEYGEMRNRYQKKAEKLRERLRQQGADRIPSREEREPESPETKQEDREDSPSETMDLEERLEEEIENARQHMDS